MMPENKFPLFTSVFNHLNICRHTGIFCKKTYLYDDIPIHNHDHFEIELCISGYCEHWLNGSLQPIGQGDVIFLSTTDIHMIHPMETPLVLLNMRINQNDISNDLRLLLLSIPAPSIGHMLPHNISTYLNIFEKIDFAISSKDPLADLTIQGYFYLLLSEMLHACPLNLKTDNCGVYDYVKTAIGYINKHYNEQITLKDIASHINISPNYLSEIFVKQTGICISDYLTQVRILYAKSYLETTSMSITDVSSSVGFNSFSSFFRAFKKNCGISPSSYQAMKHNKNNIILDD